MGGNGKKGKMKVGSRVLGKDQPPEVRRPRLLKANEMTITTKQFDLLCDIEYSFSSGDLREMVRYLDKFATVLDAIDQRNYMEDI